MFKYLIILIPVFQLFSQTINYSKFNGEKVNISNVVQLDKPHFLSYKVNSQTALITNVIKGNHLEAVFISEHKHIFSKVKDVSLERRNNAIKLILKLSFYDNGRLISFIKYKEIIHGKDTKSKVEGFIKKDKVWYKLTMKKSFENIKYILQSLRVDVFWQFYNSTDDKKYPEINKLKPMVKDSNGNLNIEKLVKVIKENKSLLNKYLEN